jgi:hypothetical protein
LTTVSSAGPISRRRRRRRLWLLLCGLLLAVALAGFVVLKASGCLVPALHVTVTVRNTGTVPLTGLRLDQRDGGGHALIPTVAAGDSVTVVVSNDEKVGVSGIDLVDDVTGLNYGLPPARYEGSLHGTIFVEVSKASADARLNGRARSSTGSGADPKGWEPLRED